MEQFSPTTRKLVAVGLLLLFVLLGLNLATALVGNARLSLETLADARLRRARLQAMADEPLPLPSDRAVPPAVIKASSYDAAAQALSQDVRQMASAAQLSIGALTPVAQSPKLPRRLAVELRASGTEDGVIRFLGQAERGAIPLRATKWRIERPDAISPLTLSARLETAWMGSDR